MKKILLDENLPKQLQQAFSENFQILTITELGWQSKQNGELLKAMQEEEIQCLMTVDKNLQYQQNLAKYGVPRILLLT
jgi:predicted nuclease of predicted toxin-antitoxin system